MVFLCNPNNPTGHTFDPAKIAAWAAGQPDCLFVVDEAYLGFTPALDSVLTLGADNVLVVGQGHDHPWLFSSSLTAGQLSFVAGAAPAQNFSCTAKIRYRQADQACRVQIRAGLATVEFEQPQRAVTPGQSVVFYDGEQCLGGGVIEAFESNAREAA